MQRIARRASCAAPDSTRALLRRRLNRVQRLTRPVLRADRVHPRLAVGLLLDLPLRVGEEAMRVVQRIGRGLAPLACSAAAIAWRASLIS